MDKVEISPQEARQGETTGRMRIVLAASIVGTVAALAAVFLLAG